MIRRLMDLLSTADNNISALIGFFRIVHDEHLRNETLKIPLVTKYTVVYIILLLILLL